MQRVETERLSHPKVDAPCFLFTEVCEGLRWPWLDYDEAGGEGARGLWAVAQGLEPAKEMGGDDTSLTHADMSTASLVTPQSQPPSKSPSPAPGPLLGSSSAQSLVLLQRQHQGTHATPSKRVW